MAWLGYQPPISEFLDSLTIPSPLSQFAANSIVRNISIEQEFVERFFSFFSANIYIDTLQWRHLSIDGVSSLIISFGIIEGIDSIFKQIALISHINELISICTFRLESILIRFGVDFVPVTIDEIWQILQNCHKNSNVFSILRSILEIAESGKDDAMLGIFQSPIFMYMTKGTENLPFEVRTINAQILSTLIALLSAPFPDGLDLTQVLSVLTPFCDDSVTFPYVLPAVYRILTEPSANIQSKDVIYDIEECLSGSDSSMAALILDQIRANYE